MDTKLEVKLVPNSQQDRIVGFLANGQLKIKIKAKPVEGQANNYLIRLLSKKLSIPKSDIFIAKGLTSRNKVIEVRNISKEIVLGKLGLV